MIFSEETVKIAQKATARDESVLHLLGKHFIEIPPTEKERFPEKRCRVCYKKELRKGGRFYCTVCSSNPELRWEKCFNDYLSYEGEVLGVIC